MDPLLAAAAPIATGIVQLARGLVPERYLPLLSLGAGWLATAAIALAQALPWHQVPLAGLMVGLAASGLYSGGKALAGR